MGAKKDTSVASLQMAPNSVEGWLIVCDPVASVELGDAKRRSKASGNPMRRRLNNLATTTWDTEARGKSYPNFLSGRGLARSDALTGVNF